MALASLLAGLLFNDKKDQRKYAEDMRNEQRRYLEQQAWDEARGRATYGQPLQNANPQWNMAGLLQPQISFGGDQHNITTVPDGTLSFADRQKAARYAPEMVSWADRHNAEVGTRGALANLNEQIQTDINRKNYENVPSSIPFKEWNALQRSGLNSFTNLNQQEQARAALATGLNTSTGAAVARTDNARALEAAEEADRRRVLGMGVQAANVAAAKAREEQASANLRSVIAEATVKDPNLLPGLEAERALGRAQARYGGRMPALPEGKTWDINPAGPMTVASVPGWDVGMVANPGLASGLEAAGIPKKESQFTIGGVTNRPVIGAPPPGKPVVAPVTKSSILQQLFKPSVEAPSGIIDDSAANDLLGKRLSTLPNHPSTQQNYQQDYLTAVRRAIADEIALPPAYIGGSTIKRDPGAVLSGMLNSPSGSNIVAQIEALTPEQKNRIYRKALSAIDVK